MLLARRAALQATAGALLLSRRARAEDTIKIGMVTSMTGPNAQNGLFQVNGAKLAIQAVNSAGGVLGKPIELVTEDDQTTNPGAVLGFSRLVSRGDIAVYISPQSSTQTHAIAPDVVKVARPVIISGSDPSLTHAGNRWLFRCRAHDGYSARVIAEYGADDLGKRNWAIVHSTDAFGTAAMKLLTAALDKHGMQPVMVQGYTNQQADFTAVVLAVKQSGADVLASYVTYPTDLAVFARQLRQLGVTTTWIGSQAMTTATARDLAGPALFGTYSAVDFSPEANPEAAAYVKRYEETYKIRADVYGAWGLDQITVIAAALKSAGSTDPEEIRTALLGIHGLKGANGVYSFDANGDGLRNLKVVRNDSGKLVFVRQVDFDD